MLGEDDWIFTLGGHMNWLKHVFKALRWSHELIEARIQGSTWSKDISKQSKENSFPVEDATIPQSETTSVIRRVKQELLISYERTGKWMET